MVRNRLVVNGCLKSNWIRKAISKNKAYLIAKGFTQTEGIHYKEIFSPIFMKDSFRIIIALVVHFNLELNQMDIKIAFLNGDIEEEICIVQLTILKLKVLNIWFTN